MMNSVMKNASTLLAASLLATACGPGAETPIGAPADNEPPPAGELVQSDLARNTSPSVKEADVAKQVRGNNAFAVDLYKASLDQLEGGDSIASPYSVSLALAMTYAGARGETATEMAQVMHYELGQQELHPVYNYLDLTLESRGQGASGQDGDPFRLKIANSLWGQKGFGFEQDFLDTLALNYGAGLSLLDFREDPEGSRETINSWVEKKTEEKIKDLIPSGMIRPDTRLVLTNAIYFNAAWAVPFEEYATQTKPFKTLDGSSVDAEMMNQMETHGHATIGSADVVELMYEGDEVSMVLIVPEDLSAFEESELDASYLDSIDSELERKQVDISMPKFEIETTLPLTQTLQQMGMTSAFGPADFSGMTTQADLVITDVIHKAFINLDEKGTEAAAATAVIAGETSLPQADVTVNVNKPFIYLIRDVETGSVLFMGRVVDPT